MSMQEEIEALQRQLLPRIPQESLQKMTVTTEKLLRKLQEQA